ncbi:MAG: hypothetical protein ACK5ZA_07180 [Betaproteobacteria bacterium]|jgi:hypothetical protein|nr:hypothetical protein [Acetobacteraceae bacterium]
MPGAFLQQGHVALASVASAQATIATMPMMNLRDPMGRRRVRLMGSSAMSGVSTYETKLAI